MYMCKVRYMKHENKTKQNSLSKNQMVQGCVRIFLWRNRKTCVLLYILCTKTQMTNMMKISKKYLDR
jgi:hypothetical protein